MTKPHPLILNKGAIVVPVTARGENRDFSTSLILDTGASKTMLSQEALSIIGTPKIRKVNNQFISTAKGTLQAEVFKITSLKSLGLIRRNFEVVVHDLPPALKAFGIDGLLGLDFIMHKKLTIDLRNKFLVLE